MWLLVTLSSKGHIHLLVFKTFELNRSIRFKHSSHLHRIQKMVSKVFVKCRLFTLNSLYFNSSYLQLVSTTQSFPHHQIMVPQWCRTPLSVSIHSAVLRNILSPLNAHTSNRLHELYSWIWLYWTTLQPVCFPAESIP